MTSETEKKAETQDTAKNMQDVKAKLESIAKPILDGLVFIIPYLIKFNRLAHEYIMKLPENALNFLIGFVFCFFGGLYPVVFAAIQAAEHGGRTQAMKALQDIADEATKIIEESKKDDEVDDDNDGKADVDQISSQEFVRRKTVLVLKKMNPEKINRAMESLYQVWLAVAAVLAIEFARAISLALAISEFVRRPVDKYCVPIVKKVIPDEYDKWVPVILGWIAKSIGMSIAWYIQSLRSALASALIGGLMISRAACFFLLKYKITLGGLIKEDLDQTYLDEILSYGFAAMGLIFQISLGFNVPFPFSLILWPFEVSEWAIRWSITSNAVITK